MLPAPFCYNTLPYIVTALHGCSTVMEQSCHCSLQLTSSPLFCEGRVQGSSENRSRGVVHLKPMGPWATAAHWAQVQEGALHPFACRLAVHTASGPHCYSISGITMRHPAASGLPHLQYEVRSEGKPQGNPSMAHGPWQGPPWRAPVSRAP